MSAWLIGRCLALLVALLGCAAQAHEVRPAYLELREAGSGVFDVLWKTPARGELRLALQPRFTGPSTMLGAVEARQSAGAAIQAWRMRFDSPLRGQTLSIDGLDGTMTDALARIEFADGTSWVRRLTAQQPAAEIPLRPGRAAVAGEYLWLGIEHILLGIDHLLFVLALFLLTRGPWALVKTVTAFTVAHSITLALATLGVVHAPQAPVEAAVALSVVFVAAELVRARRGSAGIAAGMPWLVAFAFGLLHGFGFAGALSEVGLPEGQIPLALLFFNVGVEVGQLLFIAALAGLIASARALRIRLPRWSALLPPYAIGSLAMFWFGQRIAAF